VGFFRKTRTILKVKNQKWERKIGKKIDIIFLYQIKNYSFGDDFF